MLMKFRRVFYPRQMVFPIILHQLDADMIYVHKRIYIHPGSVSHVFLILQQSNTTGPAIMVQILEITPAIVNVSIMKLIVSALTYLYLVIITLTYCRNRARWYLHHDIGILLRLSEPV